MIISEQLLMLRNSYMRQDEDSFRLKIFDKIFNYCFFTNSDIFPTNIPVDLCFGDIECDIPTLEQVIREVFKDLNYRTCIINADFFNSANMVTVTVAG